MMVTLTKKIRLASLFAARDISKSRAVLLLTVISLGVAYSVVFISSGVLSGFSSALSSGSINTSGHITIYLEKERTEEEMRGIRKNLDSIENIAGYSVRTYAGLNIFKKGNFRGNGYAAIGIDPQMESAATKVSSSVIEGRFLNDRDSDGVVIGSTLADSLEGKTYDGKSIKVGEKLTYLGPQGKKKEFTIVGIVDPKYFNHNWTSFFLKKEAEYLDNSRKNGEIAVRVLDVERMNETKDKIKEEIPDSLVADWKEREGYMLNLITAIGYITGNITRLLILTTFILTSVFIFINVFQRKRQIGILKSMGASNRFIAYIYLMETVIFSFLSFGIGMLVFLIAHFFTNANPLPSLVGDIMMNLRYAEILTAFLSLGLASLIGSLLPIYFAVKVQIADVIRNSS